MCSKGDKQDMRLTNTAPPNGFTLTTARFSRDVSTPSMWGGSHVHAVYGDTT